MPDPTIDVEVLIVGAGISGIGTAIELLRRDQISFALIEAADEPGGTWRDNTYPCIAVDIPSSSYCYSFETDYPWSRRFATGAEIQRYVLHCADKYGVTRHIRFGLRVLRSQFDEARDTWSTCLDDGSIVTSRYLIAATGLFGLPKVPEINGLDTFAGKTMHTGRWDHGHDLGSRRVALIGTGASAVQVVPHIAKQASHLSVFQRTPIWVSPRLDAPVSSRFRALRRVLSEANLELLTFSIVNYGRFPYFVRAVEACVRFWMRRQVHDGDTAAKLIPDYGLGCKRPTTSNSYLAAFNRDNVRLVTQPIARICPAGIVTEDGTLHDVDTIILATGFLTTEQGNAPNFEVVGVDDVELGQFWAEHRRQAYAGVSVPGFPNFFLTAGPYAGGFNWFAMLEANLAHIMDCIDESRARGATRVEIERETHERYMQHIWKRAEGTVFKHTACATANSYYLDSHGDASLPQPHTPAWRVIRGRWKRTDGYRFGTADDIAAAELAAAGGAS